MISPVEIRSKEFSSGIAGYKKSEVDEFIELIASEYDAMYRQNVTLNDKVNMLSEAVKEYNKNTVLSSVVHGSKIRYNKERSLLPPAGSFKHV